LKEILKKLIPFHSRIPIRLISKLKSNTTNFDCEAFVVVDDSIYYLQNNGSKKNISIYHPKTPGNYSAQQDSFNVKGLITSATIVTEKTACP
jgi:hypothetical protein